MNRTSPGSRFVSRPARSAARWIAGAAVSLSPTPISEDIRWARVVFPRPGRPERSRWSRPSPRALAARMASERFSTTSRCPTNSERCEGRRLWSRAVLGAARASRSAFASAAAGGERSGAATGTLLATAGVYRRGHPAQRMGGQQPSDRDLRGERRPVRLRRVGGICGPRPCCERRTLRPPMSPGAFRFDDEAARKEGSRISRMFDRIAPTYDLLNHLLSANVDAAWRKTTVSRLQLRGTERCLDACTGTGDLALALVRGGARDVVGSDFAP